MPDEPIAGADLVAPEDSAESGIAAAPVPAAEPDPLAEFREAQAGHSKRLDEFQHLIGTLTGRMGKIQSTLDRPSAPDPSLKANAALVAAVANGLVESDLVSDTAKAQLRALLDQAQTSSTKAALRQEVLDVVKEHLPQAPETLSPEWQSAANRIAKYAEGKGVVLKDLGDLLTKRFDDPFEAYEVFRDAVDEKASAATKNVAARRAAAGPGSPPGTGVNQDQTLIRKFANGESMTAAERKRAEELLTKV